VAAAVPALGSGTRHVVVMGVSGSGKTVVGAALAARLGWRFIDADDLHPRGNIVKMSRGEALTDSDRVPWLAAVARQLTCGGNAIAACSALKRAYRDMIIEVAPGVLFVHLDVPAATLLVRMKGRQDHFMPASLLQSQLSTLESLGPDETGITIPAGRQLDDVVAELVARFTVGERA
jgi:carbohydrate kinase (thermoresistant glucokinase family)